MERIHMIGWALLLTIGLAGAISVVVTTEAEALAILGTGANLTRGECEILGIEKTINNPADIANDWIVTYSMRFTRDGTQDRRTGSVGIANNTEQAVKSAVAPACEAKWAEIQAQNATIDSVDVKSGYAQNNALGALYDLGKKTWKNTIGIGQ